MCVQTRFFLFKRLHVGGYDEKTPEHQHTNLFHVKSVSVADTSTTGVLLYISKPPLLGFRWFFFWRGGGGGAGVEAECVHYRKGPGLVLLSEHRDDRRAIASKACR